MIVRLFMTGPVLCAQAMRLTKSGDNFNDGDHDADEDAEDKRVQTQVESKAHGTYHMLTIRQKTAANDAGAGIRNRFNFFTSCTNVTDHEHIPISCGYSLFDICSLSRRQDTLSTIKPATNGDLLHCCRRW